MSGELAISESKLSQAAAFLDKSLDHGHYFVKKTFHKPAYCHHCTDLLWGFIGQGLMCRVCNFTTHEKCAKLVVSLCTSYAADQIKNPAAHCLTESGHFKKKFCNVCHKRLDDADGMRCEICEYYVHTDCRDFIVSDCKECATYTPQIDLTSVLHFHHWREGNLPSSSKCVVCKKTCWSSECLTGTRCEWCSTTAHSYCYKNVAVDCTFGSLRQIMLPPSCVTVPRLNFNIGTILCLDIVKPIQGRIASSDEWSSGELRGDDESSVGPEGRRTPREAKDKDEMDVFHVFDGDEAYRSSHYRKVQVPKNSVAKVALEESSRAFHIPGDPSKLYLCEVAASSDTENYIDERYPVRDQLRYLDGSDAPSLCLRSKEKERGHIKVYTDGLLPLVKQPLNNYVSIPVNKETTAATLVQVALDKFGVQDESPDNFLLSTVLLNEGRTNRKLGADEKPFLLMQQIRKESLRVGRMTRFYLQLKEDPHGPSIALFVANLPTGLPQRQYEKILLDVIGIENKWVAFDVIYYEHGSLVITYSSPEKATYVFHTLQQVKLDEKALFVMLLPNIQPHMLPEGVTPLLVFVNVKSGGCQGQQLLGALRKMLNPLQVFDLQNGGPVPGLFVFRNVPKYKILVCGGDGTVGWVLQCLDNVGQDAVCQSPPIAVLPIGTGNDLARVLRWGPGYTGNEDLSVLLQDVVEAEDVSLDRWAVIFYPNEKEVDESKQAVAGEAFMADANEDATSMFVMNNYMGIGIDADLALDFHNAREENPDKFNSRLHNKGVYFKMSLRKMVNRTPRDLSKLLRIEVDGKPLDLPQIEGLIILNILSWAAGANPWGPEKDDAFTPPTHYDGMLELVGITGVLHMGQIHSGIRNAMRLAQASHIRISLLADLPVHVDAEPWIQTSGQVVILKSALKATMLKKLKQKMKRRNTEPGASIGATCDQPSGSPQITPSASVEEKTASDFC